MAQSREADHKEHSKTRVLTLAKDVRRAQELRAAELERAFRSYERASEGSLHHAAEFLRMVQKGDAVYDRAMRDAQQRYRIARSGEAGEAGPGV